MVNWTMIGAMVLPNVGGWAGALTMTGEVKSTNGTAWYESIRKPKWNPPNWVFGPAWTALYSSMGFASYLVYRDCGGITGEIWYEDGNQSFLKCGILICCLSILYTFKQYLGMSLSKQSEDKSVVPLSLYGAHLLINWTWTPVFFKFHKIGLAFFHILALDAAATACTVSFFNINKNTLFFMAPYLCWLTFATYLNYTIWQLNGDGEKKKVSK